MWNSPFCTTILFFHWSRWQNFSKISRLFLKTASLVVFSNLAIFSPSVTFPLSFSEFGKVSRRLILFFHQINKLTIFNRIKLLIIGNRREKCQCKQIATTNCDKQFRPMADFFLFQQLSAVLSGIGLAIEMNHEIPIFGLVSYTFCANPNWDSLSGKLSTQKTTRFSPVSWRRCQQQQH